MSKEEVNLKATLKRRDKRIKELESEVARLRRLIEYARDNATTMFSSKTLHYVPVIVEPNGDVMASMKDWATKALEGRKK